MLPGSDAPSWVQLEAISREPWNDVKMDMWNKLRGCLAVGQEEVDGFAAES